MLVSDYRIGILIFNFLNLITVFFVKDYGNPLNYYHLLCENCLKLSSRSIAKRGVESISWE